MKKYFKVKTNYLKKDEATENTNVVSEVRLFEAVDYTDAQKQAIQIINTRGCCGECDLDIQRVSYDLCLYRDSEKSFVLKDVKENQKELTNKEDEEKTYWYEIKITELIPNDKGEEKYKTTKYLVEGIDLEDSITIIREYLKDENEDYWWFTSISETPIEEVYLLNNIQ